MYKKLVLSGGGINGIIYIGIIKYLEEQNLINNFDVFVGTSVGSLINTLIILGYKAEEIEDFILEFNFSDIIKLNILKLFTDYGIDDGSLFEILIKCFIRNKLKRDNFTLIELYNLTKKRNIIVTCNISKNKCMYIDHISHPNLKIITALKMSTCIPFYFKPVSYKNELFVDGSLLCHFGINIFGENDSEVLGILLKNDNFTEEVSSFDNYISLLLNLYTNLNKYKNKNIIKIDYIHNILDFSIKKEEKKKLINIGYNKIFNYLKKIN